VDNPNHHLFQHCPGCGKKGLSPGSVNSFFCKSCGFKFYLNNAAAGIALIFNADKQILVTKRKNNPAKGTLEFPGGFSEPGETMEISLIREIKEELNLEIEDLRYFCSVSNQYLYKNVLYPITDMVFWCRVNDFSTIAAKDDVAEYYFLDTNQLKVSQFGLNSPNQVVKKIQSIKF